VARRQHRSAVVRRPLVFLALFFFLANAHAAPKRRAVAQPLSRIDHVFVVVLENQSAARAIGGRYLSRLASEGAYLANYHAITNPSQPNYLALVSGSTHGVNDNTLTTINVAHIGDLLEARGLTWRLYAEDYPGDCSLAASAANGVYVRRHVPFLSFANVQQNGERCRRSVVNATQLDADIAADALPTFAMYVPNNLNNGHDTSAEYADAFLERRFAPLLRDPRFTKNMLFIITYDEALAGDTHVATVLWGSGVVKTSSLHRYDHYDLLRTIEDLFHLGTLGLEDQWSGEAIRDVLRFDQ
jgi:acid phosphatase